MNPSHALSANASADANAAQTDGAFRKLNFNYNREQSWTGQLTGYVQAALQWANTNLDSSEKIYLGGASGVRPCACAALTAGSACCGRHWWWWRRSLRHRRTRSVRFVHESNQRAQSARYRLENPAP